MAVHARQVKCGINIATSGSWGTGVATATAVGAGDGHYVMDDLGVQLSVNYTRDESAGQNFIGSVQTATTAAINGVVPTFLHYNDVFQNVLWALTLGTGGTAPVQIGATTAYTNTFEPATNKTGRYATIVRDKSQFVTEVPGAKFTGFEISYGEAGRAEIRWAFLGDREVTDSAINTSTQVAALTFPTLGLRAHFDDMVFRLNSQSGGALGAGDAVKVSSLRVRFAQPLDTRYVGGQVSIIEPEEDGFPECVIEVEFGRFDSVSDDFFAHHRDGVRLKGDIIFTGPTLATTNYGLMLQFPNLTVGSPTYPVRGGAGQVYPGVTLAALSTTTAPTGMTGVTVPIRVTTTGVSTTNPFA